ncbi:MAG TPA: T9SS type A sorting domain-containing protein [Ferruginibacter sp.]|nr:T9SS type A sorting domain-containing protein [Ferruginibacter sp.]HMP19865.1 T9SS type A sorting domain-containing protein [Ferruginibacter sp.]
MRKQLALFAFIFCHCITVSAQPVLQAATITGKTICGYQGWFNCFGDGSPVARWFHWSNGQYQTDNGKPAPGQLKFEMYPAIEEYNAASLYQTNFAVMGDGITPSTLFSSYKEDVIQKHFSWMENYGIDGIALQRFISETFDGVFKLNRDTIAARVKRQAENHGRIFYLMYDISGMDAAKFDSIKTDWQNNMVGTLHLTASPYYVHQDNKPVVCLWGFGFTDRPGTAAQCLDVINWFKANGCFVIGGVPTNWRTSSGDSKPGFASVYDAYDMISPWSVGRFSSNTGADNFKTNYLEPDLAYCNSKNILYQPVVFPGFAWANWNGGPQNEIPRNRGEFMWRQVYNISQSGIGNMYVAMFDEYDEGTAIAKAADSYYAIPSNQYFLTTSADGSYLSPDFYLRLTDQATKVINGTAPLTATVPIPHSNGPIWFRSGFELKYDAAVMAADAPETTAGNTNVIGYGGTANPPECGVVSEINHIGNYALRYAGRDNSSVSSRYYYRVFDVNIPVDITTQLSFWTFPQNNLARYVSVDLLMTDGSFLHNTAATDKDGVSMHPSAGRGIVNTWTKTVSNIGQWLNGKTIQRILIGYDHDAETGDFRGYIDDILIDTVAVPTLPVKLAGFSGAVYGKAATLNWHTVSETNASHIVLERSYDSRSFETVTTMAAGGTEASVSRYNYTDTELLASAPKVFYRLRFVDKDGGVQYSHVLALSISLSPAKALTVAPNPARDYVQLNFTASGRTEAQVTITDALGRRVMTRKINTIAGNNAVIINNLYLLAPGMYRAMLVINGKPSTVSFMVAQ